MGVHTVVCTEPGELYTFGQLGHGDLGRFPTEECDVVVLLMAAEALAGKKVVQTSAVSHTYSTGSGQWVQWTGPRHMCISCLFFARYN